VTEAVDSSEIRFGSKIGRFVIDGELGSGGMGVVYAAHDRELDRHVALKVLRGAIDEESRQRLLREGQAMARITHPNVITVYEVGTEGRMVFLAQELLDGGSLRQWLEAKPRSQRDIIDKFAAAGHGLAAAHAKGLVHRDFKPDNVLLGKDGRVRVADFGLARSLGALETMADASRVDAMARTTGDIMRSPMATMTRTGAVMGTPLYMSPEQHRGEATDERSDQFSFCVALYQALYGDVPFPGKTAIALADAVIAGRMQPPPKQAKVSARVRKILLRGLANDPAQRYPSMDALIADLLHDPGRKLRRIGVYAAIGVLVLGALVGGYMISQRRKGSGDLPDQRVIAVMGFQNLSGDKSIDWISTGFSELLGSELAQGDKVRVIAAEEVAAARRDLGLPNTQSFAGDTLARLEDRLHCNAVIVGSYLQSNGVITIVINVQDIGRGNKKIEVKGTDLPKLAKDAAPKIREALGISLLGSKGTYLALPKDSQAAAAYIEGIEKLHKFDYQGAKEKLLLATKRAPDFAPAYIELAAAHQGLFEGELADKAARKALETAKSLGVDQQLFVMGRAHELLGEPDKAREFFRRLFAMTPNLENGLALLRVESPEDFANTIASVRRLEGAANEPRVDLLEARLLLDKASPQRALELAQKAWKAASEGGDVSRQADAKRTEGEANMALGNLTASAKALDDAWNTFNTQGDKLSAMEVSELRAGVSLEQGALDDAFAKYDAIAELRMKSKQPERAAIASAAAAYALALRGKIGDAEKRLKEAEARKGQDPIAIPYVDLATAQIKWARGEIDAALKASDKCAERFGTAMQSLSLLCSQINGEIRADRGDSAEARKRFDELQQTAQPFPHRADELKILLAQLDLEEIDPTDDKADDKAKVIIDALKPIQKAASDRGAATVAAHAAIVIARADLLMAANQPARDEVDEDKPKPQALRLRVQWQLAWALATYHKGDADDAQAKISEVRAEADKQTCIALSLETRLARAQVIGPEDGKAELEAVMRDAKARGFGRIVKLAEGVAKLNESSAPPPKPQ